MSRVTGLFCDLGRGRLSLPLRLITGQKQVPIIIPVVDYDPARSIAAFRTFTINYRFGEKAGEAHDPSYDPVTFDEFRV